MFSYLTESTRVIYCPYLLENKGRARSLPLWNVDHCGRPLSLVLPGKNSPRPQRFAVQSSAPVEVECGWREENSGDTSYGNKSVTPCQAIVYWLSIRTVAGLSRPVAEARWKVPTEGYAASGAAGKLPRRSKNNPWAGRCPLVFADQIGAAGWCPEATLCNDALIVYNCR